MNAYSIAAIKLNIDIDYYIHFMQPPQEVGTI